MLTANANALAARFLMIDREARARGWRSDPWFLSHCYNGEHCVLACKTVLADPRTIAKGLSRWYDFCSRIDRMDWFYDCSVEGVIINAEFAGLFTVAELAEAGRRLNIFHRPYVPPRRRQSA